MPEITSDLLRQVKQIELRTRGLVAALFAGEYRSVFRGQGMEFAEVRAYGDGDDYRSIDWNVSARLGSPYVKTFAEERELTLMLVVDRSGSTEFGEPRSKAAVAVEIAAVLALAAAWHGDRVGALLFADKVERVVPPAKGRRHALRVIRDVLASAPAGRRTNLAAALTYALDLLAQRAIVVVLSDFLAEGWERPMRQLAARHDVVAVTVDDPRERALPPGGWLELEDLETSSRRLLDLGRETVRRQASLESTRRVDDRRRILGGAGVDVVPLVTGEDYAVPLRRAFAARARRLHRG